MKSSEMSKDTKKSISIRFGCMPFMVALIIMMCLKVSGTATMSWWTVFLLPVGLYFIYVVFGLILFLIWYTITNS